MSAVPSLPTVVFVGGGPRTTGTLLAIAARLREAGTPPADRALDIHVVDPYPAGPGRIWRSEQPEQVWMNNTSDQMTIYADGDPHVPGALAGPTIADWIGEGGKFIPRRDAAIYLRDAFDKAVAALPPGVTVTEHRAKAVSAARSETPDGSRTIRLDDGTKLHADVTVLAQGYLDVRQDGAAHPGHTPPGYTVDQDFSHLPAGEDVLVRGFGLAFIDLMMMLTEGRGGRFAWEDTPIDSQLIPEYHPSGREPVLWVGSRRGVPYRSKLPDGPPQVTPRYLAEDVLARLPRTSGGVLPDGVLESLLNAEITDAWYVTLAESGVAESGRISLTVDEIHTLVDPWVDGFIAGDRDGAQDLRAKALQILEAAVPDPEDRLDLERLDRPFADREVDGDAVEDAVEDIVVANLRRVASRHFPQDGALYSTLVTAFFAAGSLAAGGALSAADQQYVASLASTFSYVCSGPPPERLANLVALHRAGVVRFLGPDAEFRTLPEGSPHRYASSSVSTSFTDRPVEVAADRLVDARLAPLSADRLTDDLLSGLLAEGEIVVKERGQSAVITVDPDDRVVASDGSVADSLFLIGPTSSSPVIGGFGRPNQATQVFPANDALAATVLDTALTRDASATRSRELRSARS
ncbi:hypothetical protein CGLY_14530 [Corynebacterium glyciniphilum AJ 3170]|uniref:FAD-dependent urate hydroxylase HpyO/Asp monooxygenase CreE-like FAD/NAD(P)-binding domain-containing protein n=1 Tax=Corynebacterium glyciniphilum AJ 3170 TaxID=1404245 RepID=X5DXP5_9CORY|nr:FAD/NAD(P)-binding protein [Corynebacterium glyciniphilum]AHW65342.1 hypothetical protein CGLY_14530 [Corynebacterium glyciniphilum AJ 3170]